MLEMTFYLGQERKLIAAEDVGRIAQNSVPYPGQPSFQGRQGDYNDQILIHLRYWAENRADHDGGPVNMSGANLILEGILPDKEHRIVENAIMTVIGSPEEGNCRVILPAPAFTVAGQYVASYFRLIRDHQSVATLEFNFSVISDPILNGIKAEDHLPEYYAIRDKIIKLQETLQNSNDDLINKMNQKFQNELTDWTKQLQTVLQTAQNLQTQMDALEGTIKSNQVVTVPQLQGYVMPNTLLGTLHLTDMKERYPRVRTFVYQYGAGIPNAPAGGSEVHKISCRLVRDHIDTISIYISPDQVLAMLPEFSFRNGDVALGRNGVYAASGINCIGIEVDNSTIKAFDNNESLTISK
ncbi:BppU family phage baseplate upper protein [Limosilactobacillus reuteri]|uniref:BppU family phage baseplate upper protein n=1 Tax=Limosilactobacillus reuteri TaxID=1598 RepID=UPI001E2E12EA|nr:BppU family phage baseplate upper protein [Limosilactobacillus reuteri]MCC4414306.1 BppU family phage baseplate upper protein [Limosilactobacillus reuteri]